MIEVITQSKTTHKKLIFEQGSSDVKGQTNFSDKYWGKVMCKYVHSAKNFLKVSKEHIFTEARKFSKDMTSRHDRDQSVASSNAHTKEAPLGHRAVLIDIT